MAYSSYFHCMTCGGKALYDDSDTPCAHCDPSEPDAIEVYCSTCTTRRRTEKASPSTSRSRHPSRQTDGSPE